MKISIADIIISFELEYEEFRKKLKEVLAKFIVKSDRVDLKIKLNKVETYKLIDGNWDYFDISLNNSKELKISKWDINGKLNKDKTQGEFDIHKDIINFYPLIKFIILNISSKFNTILLHSSSMVNKDYALVASGVSGSGKSTFAKKLEEEGFIILHDEITLIRKINSSFYIYPTPFDYNPKHIVNFSQARKLKTIFFLKRKEEKYIKNISLKKFYKEILKVILAYEINRVKDYNKNLDIVNELYKAVKVKELSFDINKTLVDKIL